MALFLAFVCDCVRIQDGSAGTGLYEQPWAAWAEEHIHPGNGELFHQMGSSSALIEDAETIGPIAIAAGAMLEPGSRAMFNNLVFVRRRRARWSDQIEGPTPFCFDKPECTQMMLDGTLNCSKVVARTAPRSFTPQMDCPVSCNTRAYIESHCIEHTSPCSTGLSPCKNGFRPRTECVPFFMYQGAAYSGCKHDGPRGRRVWCPHQVFASTEEDLSESCDECMEQTSPGEDEARWEPVAKKLRCIEVAMTAGDTDGRKFSFENRGKRLDVQQPMASGGKWLAAVSLATAVHRGFLRWDTLASDVFPWWTKDDSDPRSRVTFRHLMNFNSGFYIQGSATDFSHNGLKERCLTYGFAMFWTPITCAEQIYNQALHAGEPGYYFDYNSYHFQIAFGMVLQASGMEAREWLRVTLLEPVGMTDTDWLGGSNPLLSSGILSTGNDHSRFLQKYLAYEILPKDIIDVVETEALTNNNVSTKYNSLPFNSFAMGSWYEAPCRRMGGLTRECVNREANIYIALYRPLDAYGNEDVESSAIDWIKEAVVKALRRE